MTIHDDIATLRQGLFAGTRGKLTEIAPVPSSPVGDAHLALDRVEAEIARLHDGLRLAASGEIIETTLTSETVTYPRGAMQRFRSLLADTGGKDAAAT